MPPRAGRNADRDRRVIGLAIATALVASLSDRTLSATPRLVPALYAVAVVAYRLFVRLVVTVDGRVVRAAFGVGWIAKEVPLSADVVRTRLRWGWRIHWTPAGWLYNVG